jgi:DNA (cytosine-5)-methyltransferase 1
MKYLSVCSGIEAASVAWEPLGWEAVGFSEIEPFPCAVLAHHYPHVPLHGDFTVLIENPPSCDVLVGGTPCQAFSVAGARQSLDDARGNLSLAYVELANAIDRKNHAEGQEPCITVWENVPGVFSTKDNAFGCFLRGLAGGVSSEDGPLEPPGGRWTHCGAVLGPQRAVAWRVLDAQYFGLAQRRQRVFVVASARNGFDPTQVLLEWEGVRRDTPPSRPTRENPAAASGVSPAPRGGEHAGRGDGRVETPCPDPAGPIGGAGQSGGFRTTDLDNNGSYIVGALTARFGGSATGAPEVDAGLYIPVPKHERWPAVVAPTLNAHFGNSMGIEDQHALGGAGLFVPFPWPQRENKTIGWDNDLNASEEQMGTLLKGGMGGRHEGVLTMSMVVRRLTPRECERLQGFPDSWTLIPWRGKPADQCPDGPRYKALGNSMAVPVMRWIGRRIDAHVRGSIGDSTTSTSTSTELPNSEAVAFRVHSENSIAMTGKGNAQVADVAVVARALDTQGGYSSSQGGNIVLQSLHLSRDSQGKTHD